MDGVSQRSSSQISLSGDKQDNGRTSSFERQRSGSSDVTSSLGSQRRLSLSFSRRVTPQLFDDDFESEIVSQAGDIGDRAIHSNRNSESGSTRQLSMDNGFALLPEEQLLPTYGFYYNQSNELTAALSTDPLPSELVSPLSCDAILDSKDENQNRSLYASQQHPMEDKKELPPSLEYMSCLTHLAVFGILGVLTRYLLQKLFGPTVAGVTSDQTALYLDLPSNMDTWEASRRSVVGTRKCLISVLRVDGL